MCEASSMASAFHRAVTTISRSRSDVLWVRATARLVIERSRSALQRVERRSEKRAPVEIFTPTELAAILASFTYVAPCLALGAFAGLRSAEILRLEWSDTERHQGFIEVAAHKAKTATRRIVPVADNLAKWLAIAPRSQRARLAAQQGALYPGNT